MSTPNPLARFHDRLSLPLIAAPMFLVSGVELVVAACRNGVIGAFPTVNCRSPEQLDGWLLDIEDRLRREKRVTLRQLVEGRASRSEMIGVFLALLELIREKKILVHQAEALGELVIESAPEEHRRLFSPAPLHFLFDDLRQHWGTEQECRVFLPHTIQKSKSLLLSK